MIARGVLRMRLAVWQHMRRTREEAPSLAESTFTEALTSVALLQFLHPWPTSPSGFSAASLSGFVVEAGLTKYVVSAAHFEARSHRFVARFLDQGLDSPLTVALREFDEARGKDVALFSIDDSSVRARLRSAVVASDERFAVSDEAYIVGYPCPDVLKDYYRVDNPVQVLKKGIVSAKIGRTADRAPLLLLDAIWDQGMSGGPVIHATTGHVIGVVSSRPVVKNQMLEFITCPSGDQILDALSRLKPPAA